ncbi:MAG: hypothetical protein HQ503_07155 [Rhodospirillales bacterium]|nr:hypothetical protein [Rhodospirillales bacterium]
MLEIHTENSVEDETIQNDDDALYCSACGHFITRVRWRISRRGDHEHTVFNQAGLLFRIACYADAPGITIAGQPSDEFTWFPGYDWTISCCANCSRHMGWKFTGEDVFFGLIASNLKAPLN